MKGLYIKFENQDIESLQYFAEKYSDFTYAEAIPMLQKDPEFSVSMEELPNFTFYKIRLSNQQKLN